MKGLQDNSSEYDPNRKLEDFSVAFLANLAREYARAYLAMDGFWNGAVRQRVGDKEALDCELVVWRRIASYVIPRIARLANIELPVKDVVEAIKVWQIGPDYAAPDIYRIRPEIIETLCHVVEVAAAEAQCYALHPRMKMTPLKLPPRKSPDEIACQWEFKIEE